MRMTSTRWMRLGDILAFALIGALAFTWAAKAATLPATPASFDAAFAKAAIAGGDTISLAPGAYGDAWIGPKRFAGKTTLTCADPANPPVFRSINIRQTSNLTLACLRVAFTPDASTVTFSAAVKVQDSDHIAFNGVKIVGGNALSGAPETATELDGTGNVIGWPTAYGLQIANSSFVGFAAGEVARFHKGITLQGGSDLSVTASDLHDMRTTALTAGGVSRVLIDGNRFHDAAPWAWGKTRPGVDEKGNPIVIPYGDHADFIAMWTVPGQVGPSDDIRITNNSFTGAPILVDGVAQPGVLGGWLQGQTTAFTNTVWSGNSFNLANLQAIALWGVKGGSIDGNVMCRSGGDEKWSPGILIRDGVSGVSVTRNTLGAPLSDTTSGPNPASGNVVRTGSANLCAGAATPPVVGPPAVTPPAPDLRDARIADLTAQLAKATADLAAAKASGTASAASLAALQARLDLALKDLDGDRAALAAFAAPAAAAASALASNPLGR